MLCTLHSSSCEGLWWAFGPNPGPSGLWPNSLWSHVPPSMCAKLWISSMNISVSKSSCHHQWLGWLWGFLTGDIQDMSHPWHFKCCLYMISNMSTKFWLANMIRSVSRTPCHHQVLGAHWGFLTRDMENMGHYWFHNCYWHLNPSLCAKFIAWLEVCK